MKAKGLSASTIRQARAVLGSIMRQAHERELVDRNPVKAVKPPTLPDHRRRPRPTPAMLAKFIAAARAEGEPWEVPMLLAATTGARRSEVLAISWTAVDLPACRKVRIARSLQKAAPPADRPFFADVKSEHGRREIPLLPAVAARLRSHRKEQLERRVELGAAWHDDDDLDLVCDRGDGLYLEPDAMTDAFRRIAKAAGLPPRRFHLHDLRHAVATALLLEGVNPAIATALLGHADPAFTMRVYQEVTPAMTEQAAAALGRALGGGESRV